MDRGTTEASVKAGVTDERPERPITQEHAIEFARDNISRAIVKLSLVGRLNPPIALELVTIFESAAKRFGADCSFGIADVIRAALKVSPVNSMPGDEGRDGSPMQEQAWQWIDQLCDEAACYSRALAEQGAVAIFNNDRMGELFMSTGEICTRIRQLRLLPFFHWFSLVHPADVPVVSEALAPVMCGHGINRQADVVAKCRKRNGEYVASLLTFRVARRLHEGTAGIIIRIWPLESRIFQPSATLPPNMPAQEIPQPTAASSDWPSIPAAPPSAAAAPPAPFPLPQAQPGAAEIPLRLPPAGLPPPASSLQPCAASDATGSPSADLPDDELQTLLEALADGEPPQSAVGSVPYEPMAKAPRTGGSYGF